MDKKPDPKSESESARAEKITAPPPEKTVQPVGEQNGPQGPEPTRYGDWEIGGRCSDF